MGPIYERAHLTVAASHAYDLVVSTEERIPRILYSTKSRTTLLPRTETSF